jgi:DNA-binding Lrp family transcriptional regulator
MDEIDRALIVATQGGLPLVARPYHTIGEQIGIAGEEVMRRMQALLNGGIIRRIGAVPNHYAIGWSANGMTVWDVADDKVDRIGTARRCAALCDSQLSSPARLAGLAVQPVRHGARQFARGMFRQSAGNSSPARRCLPG